MNVSLLDVSHQLRAAVLQYSALVQAIAHQEQPNPHLEREYQTALGTLMRLQAVQDMLLFEQEGADYSLLVEANHEYANVLRKALDSFSIPQAREEARKLDQSYKRTQDSFETAAAYLDDYAHIIYQQAYNAYVRDSGDETKAETVGLITACRTVEGYLKSLTKPVNADYVIKQWVEAGGPAEKATRLSIAFQLND